MYQVQNKRINEITFVHSFDCQRKFFFRSNEKSVPATNNSGVINSNNSSGNGFNLSVPATSLSVPATAEDENQLDTLQLEENKIQSSSKKYKTVESKQEKALSDKDFEQTKQSQKVSQSAVSFTLTKQQR